MRRLIGDVPRWSLYLHRASRGLPRADLADGPEHKLEDEIFERLFAGELEPLDDGQRDRVFGGSAQRVHDTLGELPAFERLAKECRGRADESAMAVEELVRELRPEQPDDRLRRSARTACGKAATAIEELRELMEGLELVAFGHIAGSQPGERSTPTEGNGARLLASRLRDNPRLRRIALLAGRFRRIAATKRRQRVRHGSDEIVDVEQGGEVSRLLPAELVKLTDARLRLLALRDLLERQSMQYRLEGKETLGRGPLVVEIDKSGSMAGERDIWATAIALALLDVAKAEARPFALVCFDAHIKHETIVMPGDALPEDALSVPADGGTNIDRAVGRGLDIIELHPEALREADIVLVTDGASAPDEARELRARAAKLGVSILGVAIDADPGDLSPWCDTIATAQDMERVDDALAATLFASGGDTCGPR